MPNLALLFVLVYNVLLHYARSIFYSKCKNKKLTWEANPAIHSPNAISSDPIIHTTLVPSIERSICAIGAMKLAKAPHNIPTKLN